MTLALALRIAGQERHELVQFLLKPEVPVPSSMTEPRGEMTTFFASICAASTHAFCASKMQRELPAGPHPGADRAKGSRDRAIGKTTTAAEHCRWVRREGPTQECSHSVPASARSGAEGGRGRPVAPEAHGLAGQEKGRD